MAGQVPSFRGPGYGADFSARTDALTKIGADRTAAELEAYSGVLRSLIGNAKGVAEVSGSGALDRIAQAHAGAQGPLFGGDYGSAMDRLRQQGMQADIAATNRGGSGGGGGDKGMGTGDMLVSFDGGPPQVIKASDYDMWKQQETTGGPTVTVVGGGKTYTPGDTRTVVKEYEDGSVEYSDGTTGMKE